MHVKKYQVLSKPELKHLQHATQFIVGCANAIASLLTSHCIRPAVYCMLTLRRSLVGPDSSSTLSSMSVPPVHVTHVSSLGNIPAHLPKFGRGSSSCAGKENRTEAISVTPTNLSNRCNQYMFLRCFPGPFPFGLLNSSIFLFDCFSPPPLYSHSDYGTVRHTFARSIGTSSA